LKQFARYLQVVRRKKRFIRVKELSAYFIGVCLYKRHGLLYEIEWYHGEVMSSSLMEVRGEDFFMQ